MASIAESGTCVPPGPSKNASGRSSAPKRARTASTVRAVAATRGTVEVRAATATANGAELHLAVEPGVAAGVAAGSGDRETLQVVIPPMRVRLRGLRARQVAVGQTQRRPLAVGNEVDLDRRRARRHRVLAVRARLPAPGEHEPPGRIELHELAARRVAGDDADAVDAARTRVERRRLPHPARRLLLVDEELPYRLRARRDRDLPLDDRGVSRCLHASPPPPVPPRA